MVWARYYAKFTSVTISFYYLYYHRKAYFSSVGGILRHIWMRVSVRLVEMNVLVALLIPRVDDSQKELLLRYQGPMVNESGKIYQILLKLVLKSYVNYSVVREIYNNPITIISIIWKDHCEHRYYHWFYEICHYFTIRNVLFSF